MTGDITLDDFNSISFNKIGINFQRSKIIVYRRDRDDCPHLTLSWDNKSGMIDLHLTTESSEKKYESILQINQKELIGGIESGFHEITEIILANQNKMVKKFRFGWLKRNGYHDLHEHDYDSCKYIIRRNKKKIFMDFNNLFNRDSFVENMVYDFSVGKHHEKIKLIVGNKPCKMYSVLSCDPIKRNVTCLNPDFIKKFEECLRNSIPLYFFEEKMHYVHDRLKLDDLQIDVSQLSGKTDSGKEP